jgi:hypothetical protein
MNLSQDVFCEIPCLSEVSPPLDGLYLHKKWFKTGDKRTIGQHLQKFVNYNQSSFSFLGVQPSINGVDQNINLTFRSSNYIGTAPLRSSVTGKQIGDFVVIPRFQTKNTYIELLDYLGNEINPEYFDGLPLASRKNFRPPLYLEAIKFIRLLEKLVQFDWIKFANFEKKLSTPSGQVNWHKYVLDSWSPEKRLLFPSRINTLNEFHIEYSQIKFVYNLCRNEINSNGTPIKIKSLFKDIFLFLDSRLYPHNPKSISKFTENPSERTLIRELKKSGNNFLSSNISNDTGWRIDFSIVFEKYVQKIFHEISKETGHKFSANIRFKSSGFGNLGWSLSYFEPDLILHRDQNLVFIDAKYKSNILNKSSKSEILKEEHRKDLHQLLSYCAFDSEKNKLGILCYPSNKFECHEKRYTNPLNGTENIVRLVGIPLDISELKSCKRQIQETLN